MFTSDDKDDKTNIDDTDKPDKNDKLSPAGGFITLYCIITLHNAAITIK